MIYKVLGKSRFTSKKTGKECCIFQLSRPYIETENGVGERVKEQFVPAKCYDAVSVGSEVDILYNETGFVQEVIPQ